MKDNSKRILELTKENRRLKKELKLFHTNFNLNPTTPTVSAPEHMMPFFNKAQKVVGKYFKARKINPEKGMIELGGERYLLVRASALSYDFFNSFKKLYSDRSVAEATSIANTILFDIAHLIGKEDAQNFQKKMALKSALEKLTAGPVHFAFTGWAKVHILPESNPSPDENFFLKYNHPYSFEADSWLRVGKKSKDTVCIMNAGYSSGWCEESFGMPLTSVEITCKARGDKECTFIMAPPHKIVDYLKGEKKFKKNKKMKVPAFMEREKTEEQLRASLLEKEVLIKEIHHRVKNNLQVIASLLNLQSNTFEDKSYQAKIHESISRIKSMAIVHELLYSSNDLSNINIKQYLESLLSYISSSYSLNSKVKFELNTNFQSQKMDIDKAIPCGLILNEMVSNALKYAFKNDKKGKITVSFSEITFQNNPGFELMIEDNGIGFPKNINFLNSNSFGLQIVNSLVNQLSGTIHLEKSKGTKFVVRF